jgi:hypothetical protein
MDVTDVLATAEAAPAAELIAVHCETVNHCLLRRADLRNAADRAGLGSRLRIPADGEVLSFEEPAGPG